ncbi:MAG: hypothetical protein KGH61_03835 [Candidatus Micrarchaeota archaeon]|nr:hypothetical protein [Candidatus Micrarchaeota archaeon]MDE1848052.1 hypothetical protein [Candidatus Micrarchaeota archaeon]
MVIVTSAGTFVLPPAYKVATLKGNTIDYEFVPELAKGMQVLVRKDIADVKLEEDVKPTLWARSDQYRQDRVMLFNSLGNEGMPDQAKFGTFIKDSMERNGISRSHDSENADAVMTLIKPNFNYSMAAVLGWVSGKTMLPNDPQVALYLAQQLHNQKMTEWVSKMIENDMVEVRRLRTVHRAVMAAIAAPKEHTVTAAHSSSSGHAQHIVQISPYLQAIKQQYGNDIFQEFVTNASILEIREVDESHSHHGANFTPTDNKGLNQAVGEQIKLIKEIVGFTNYDPTKRKEILGKYKGHENAKELEAKLLRRQEIIGDSIKKMLPIALSVTTQMMEKLDEHFEGPIRPFGKAGVAAAIENAMYLIECYDVVFDTYFSKNTNFNWWIQGQREIYKKIATEKGFGQRLIQLMEMPPETMQIKAQDILFLSRSLNYLRSRYDEAKIEKYYMTLSDFVEISLIGPTKNFKANLRDFNSGNIEGKKVALEIMNSMIDSLASYREQALVKLSNERKEFLETSDGLYHSLSGLQMNLNAFSERKFSAKLHKLQLTYGISSFYTIFEALDTKGLQELAMLEMKAYPDFLLPDKYEQS